MAGLAVVAALPVLEQAPPSHTELLKKILSANPEENDLALTKDDEPSVVPTTVEEQPQPQNLQEESQSQPQKPPQPQLQESPKPQLQDSSQPQPQDTPQEEPKPKDPPQEKPQPQDTQEEPQPQDTTQEEPQQHDPQQEKSQPQNPPEPQPQAQDPEIDPNEGPHASEGEAPGEESQPEVVEVWAEPPSIQAYPQEEDLSYESEELEQDEFNSDQQMEMFRGETDEGYVVLEANDEFPSLDTEGTFEYEQRMMPLPFNEEEEEPFLPNPEGPQMEPVLYDSNAEELSFEPNMDSSFEEEELPMENVSVELQEDSFPNDSEQFLGPSLVDYSTLDEEPQESEHEEVPHEMEEGHFRYDDYDSGSPVMGEQLDYDYGLHIDQPHWEGDMPSEYDDGPVEEMYHESQDDSPLDIFSWLVPDYFDESLDYDEPPFITSHHDDMSEKGSFDGEPEMQPEPQGFDQIPYWEEPNTAAEFFDDAVGDEGSYLEGRHEVVEDEIMEPRTFEGTEDSADEVPFESEDDAGDMTFADFYIPVNDDPAYTGIQQEYPEEISSEDGGEELFPLNEDDSIDDGFFPPEPQVKTYLDDEEQGQPDTEMFGDILFPEYPPFKDEISSLLWPAEESDEDQTEYLGEDIPVTILESQPTYGGDVEPEMDYPSLLDILKREIVREKQIEPWSGAKSLMMDSEDDENPPLRRDYALDSLENDAMNIIVFKDNRKNFDDFPITPLVDKPQEPFIKYVKNQPMKPFKVPQGTSDQLFPKVFFSISDELPRRKTPAFFDHMDEDISFSHRLPHHSLKTPTMRNPFTFLNEVLDDDLPPQYFPSPRNYPDTFKTPKFSFRDLLQQLNPSFYDDTYMTKRNNYPPSYSSQSYNSMQQYDGFPHQFSYTSPPMSYSAPFESFQENDYSGVPHYYANRPRAFSFHTSDNAPLSLFREDTMPKMYPHQPVRQYDEYTDDHPFMPTHSFNTPRPQFPFYQRPLYSANTPVYRTSPYSHNNFYGNGPYHPTPIYSRYAPDFY